MQLSQIIKNKVVFYLASRYLTYFVQFVTSLIIAVELGPYYMGIWGFVLLLLQYFQQIHFGVANSFNVLYVHHRDNKQECDNYIGNSLVLVSYLALLVIAFYVYYLIFGISVFEKYHANRFIIWVCIIAVLQYYVMFFVNLFRVKNQLNRVAFCQSIIVLLNFICIFLFRGEMLIDSLVAGYVVGNLLCVLLAVTSGSIPKWNAIEFNTRYQKIIIKKGLFLFLYNSCFYFIVISIRTIISGNYSVDEFGLFTFSFTLAHAILLLLEALSFVIYPKVIGKLSSNDLKEVNAIISMLRTIYITTAHLLIYLAMIFFPFFIYFMPKYEMAQTSLNLISLSILMSSCSYGYLDLMIARNKEKQMAFLSFLALVCNCALACGMVFLLHVRFSYVIMATMITYCFFTFSALFLSKEIIGEKKIAELLLEWFPIRLAIPYVSALLISLYEVEQFIILPIIIALICNWSKLRQIKDLSMKLLYKPESVNL